MKLILVAALLVFSSTASAQAIDLSGTPTTTLQSAILTAPLTRMTPIVFEGFGELRPPKNITALESAWLSVLTLQLAIHMSDTNPYHISSPDYGAFIREHHLERCFVQPTDVKP